MGGRKMLYLLVLSVLLISLSSSFVSAEITDQLKGEGSYSHTQVRYLKECISASTSSASISSCYKPVSSVITTTENTNSNFEQIDGAWNGSGSFIKKTFTENYYSLDVYYSSGVPTYTDNIVLDRNTCEVTYTMNDVCTDGSCTRCTQTTAFPPDCSNQARDQSCYSISGTNVINPVTRLSSHSSFSTNTVSSCEGDVSTVTNSGSFVEIGSDIQTSQGDGCFFDSRRGRTVCYSDNYYSVSAQAIEGVCSTGTCTEGFDACGTCGGDVSEITWSGPSVDDVSCGIPVIQTNSCGDVRTLEGTKDCCTDTSWSPSLSDVCYEDSFFQTSNCGTIRPATGTLLDETYCNIPNTPITPVCGDSSRTYDATELYFNSSSYCDSGVASTIPSYPTPDNSVSWNCIGTDSTISCSASRLACEDGFAWNVTSNSCEESAGTETPTNPSITPSAESVTCVADESIDPDGDIIAEEDYDYTWYQVDTDGTLTQISTDAELDVSRFELQNNIYVCEVVAIDNLNEQSNPVRKVATLERDYMYIPYGILETETVQLGDYSPNALIPKTVNVSGNFEYEVQSTCINGQCPNIKTTYLFSEQYLSSVQNERVVFPFLDNGVYSANTIFSPNVNQDFNTPLSSETSANYTTGVSSNEYIITHNKPSELLDYARMQVETVIYLDDGSNVTTPNRSIYLPKNTDFVEQYSSLVVQDKLLLSDPIMISSQDYTVYENLSGKLARDTENQNTFTPTGNGLSIVQASIHEDGISSTYLQELVSSIGPIHTQFTFDGFCQYELQTNDLYTELKHFTKGSEIVIELYKNDTETGALNAVTSLEGVSIEFNLDGIISRFPSNHSQFVNQLDIELTEPNCKVYEDCSIGSIIPSDSFDKETFDTLIKGSDNLGSGKIDSALNITYTDSSCSQSKTIFPTVTFNRPPIIKILSPWDRYPYYVSTNIDFNSSVVDPEGDDVELIWSIPKDEFTSTDPHFTHQFGDANQRRIFLNATDQYGVSSFDTVVIGISASPLVLAYIDNPLYSEEITSATGDAVFNGSGSYAINSTIDTTCTNPVVTCLAGDCPPTTGHVPNRCDGLDVLPIENSNTPQPYDTINFTWNFVDEEQVISGMGLKNGTMTYTSNGTKTIDLTARYIGGSLTIEQETDTIFHLNDVQGCSYDSSPSSRNHYSITDNSGSVVLTRKCVDSETTIPLEQISYVTSDSSVVQNIGARNPGIYQVLSQGSANLDILHNGINTGQSIRVSGVCGIEGISVSEELFNTTYSNGSSFSINPVTTIPVSGNDCPSDICQKDVSTPHSQISIEEISSAPLYLSFSDSANQINVTSCGLDRLFSKVRISYDPSETYFCSNTFTLEQDVKLAPPNKRQTVCEVVDSSSTATQKNQFSNQVLRFAQNHGSYNAIAANKELLPVLTTAIRDVLTTQDITGPIVDRNELEQEARLQENPLDYSTTMTSLEEPINDSCTLSLETYFNSYNDVLSPVNQITQELFVQNNIDFCIDAATHFIDSDITKQFRVNDNEQLELCAVNYDDADLACCPTGHCVYDGVCYAPGDSLKEIFGFDAVCDGGGN